jgi:hypothetical protein
MQSFRQKLYAADAEAIAEAVQRPNTATKMSRLPAMRVGHGFGHWMT